MIKQAYEKGFIDGLTKLGVDAGMAQKVLNFLKTHTPEMAGVGLGGGMGAGAGALAAPEGRGLEFALMGGLGGAGLGGLHGLNQARSRAINAITSAGAEKAVRQVGSQMASGATAAGQRGAAQMRQTLGSSGGMLL